MDRKLLDLLVCPATRQPLAVLDRAGLEALNAAIAAGGVKRADDAPQTAPLREALVTRDRRTVYRVDDGIPVLLVEEGIVAASAPGL
ncbi:MAG: Trm112 family protein [Xanthomonadales bacterium]|nr:Trm112 family protein [Xanthomonadales bacterium]